MARARDIANIINSGTFITPASASATYLSIADQSLVHISTQDFSSVSEINADSIFNVYFKSYILHLNYALSTSTTLNLRFRTDGTTNSNASYNTQTLNMNVTTVAGNRNYGANSAFLTIANGSSGACQMTFINPYTSGKETQWFNHNATGADAALTEGIFAAGTSFDGVSFYPSSGTVNTGTVSVWGLRV
jgi:hypothetical protein